MKNIDKEHLKWIYDRLVHHHSENENVDYMIKFKEIIDDTNIHEFTEEDLLNIQAATYNYTTGNFADQDQDILMSLDDRTFSYLKNIRGTNLWKSTELFKTPPLWTITADKWIEQLSQQLATGNFIVYVINEHNKSYKARVIGYSETYQTVEVEFESDNLTKPETVSSTKMTFGYESDELEYKTVQVPVKRMNVSYKYIKLTDPDITKPFCEWLKTKTM